MAPIPRLRASRGPALLSYGFRPFFLFGALYAGGVIAVWLPVLAGELTLATAFTPRDWHAHEMLYGYVPAVVTGFLLTAIPNWTGRLPIQGVPLLALLAVWICGRVAVTASAHIGWIAAAGIDSAFLALVAAAAAREIVAGRKWHNLPVVALATLLALGNLAFHVEAHLHGSADYAIRAGFAAVVMMIGLIGGRIVPSFTRNWLARQNPGRMPQPFGRFDGIAIAASVAALGLWVVLPSGVPTGIALVAAGLLQAARLARWAGDRTVADRLVLILHVGYVFIPAGFVLVGLGALGLAAASAGIHAWAAGAAGTMTLAVMTRASLGHTGRPLVASWATQVLYAAVVTAAVGRIAAALVPAWSELLLPLSAGAWGVAFLGFGVVYAPVLCRPRLAAG